MGISLREPYGAIRYRIRFVGVQAKNYDDQGARTVFFIYIDIYEEFCVNALFEARYIFLFRDSEILG